MIDWNKPLKTVEGIPATMTTMKYRLTDNISKALVLIHRPTHDSVAIVNTDTGLCMHNSELSVENTIND